MVNWVEVTIVTQCQICDVCAVKGYLSVQRGYLCVEGGYLLVLGGYLGGWVNEVGG